MLMNLFRRRGGQSPQDQRNMVGAEMMGRATGGAAIAQQGGVIGFGTRYQAVARDVNGKVLWTASAKNRIVTAGLNKFLDATLKTGLASPAWYLGLVGASISDAAITASGTGLTSASNPWAAADASRSLIVRGAGASGADLVTTIGTYNSAGSVATGAAAGTTVSGAKAAWDARAGDTMASHSPWTSVTNFSNSTRPAWTPGSISGGSVDNSGSPAVFNINADATDVFGFFMCDDNTKAGSTGTLLGMAIFGSPGSRRLNNGDTLSVTATINATPV